MRTPLGAMRVDGVSWLWRGSDDDAVGDGVAGGGLVTLTGAGVVTLGLGGGG